MSTSSIVSITVFIISAVLGIIGFLLRFLFKQIRESITNVDKKHEKKNTELKEFINQEIKRRENSYSKLEKKLNTFVTDSTFKEAISGINKQLGSIVISIGKLNTKLPENYISKEAFQQEKERLTVRLDKTQEDYTQLNSKLSAVNERTGPHKIPTR